MTYTRSFLADMEEFEHDELSTAEHLDEAVNAIFEVMNQKDASKLTLMLLLVLAMSFCAEIQ